ncbi:MAG TPA: hypothetical protein VHX13_11085 [Acidobacteriaceae bacterium]|jgi:hypothetical protein|nr:hypothetical protein [Acidobacteriaceae bacterium]
MGGLGRELKHALRMFGKNPGFTLAAVAALALGIGANTAVSTVVNAVLLKPLGYPDADRIVEFGLRSRRRWAFAWRWERTGPPFSDS